MKYFIIPFLLIAMSVTSCHKSRIKDFQEDATPDEIFYEKNGIYYTSDASHNDVEYTGDFKSYFDNRQIKGSGSIKDGIPVGHWEYWNEDGSKRLDLYFENGIVVRRIVQITKKPK